MREILFCGKRIDTGEWVEGCLVIATDGDEAVYYILPVGVERWGGAEFAKGWSVDPATVGQFTGLTDKNGKKIFEWDILVIYDMAKCPVYVKLSDFCWECHSKEFQNYRPRLENNSTKYEVIGNIHDNPELLEVDNGT